MKVEIIKSQKRKEVKRNILKYFSKDNRAKTNALTNESRTCAILILPVWVSDLATLHPSKLVNFFCGPKPKGTTMFGTPKRLSLVDASGNKVECNQEELWFDEERECENFHSFHEEKL
ncbi:hypothetical protein AVEN_91286-1 [Araneus ventricosus]|uniref:Uncharacterized protein n=1 Tax=Araneus ventricosus TaxID=182803 RepID=A0A4Y2ETQ6_ARAVE|nr:hypothetical protein AVEN_91286-1 [Araneus ventricosus]